MRRSPLIFFLAIAFTFAASITAQAEKKFIITSDPSDARIEINGQFVANTPHEKKVKEVFFNGPKYLWSEWLNTPLQMTVSKDGYVAQTIVITSGPHRWVNFNNTAEKIYYVITQQTFHIKLQKIGEFMGTNPLAAKEKSAETEGTNPLANNVTNQPASLVPSTATPNALTVEQLVQQSLPAVVTVQAGSSSGSGFFITESGIVVTNRHVVQGATQVGVTTSKGETFQSEALFVHPTKDLALIKLKAGTYPHMRLADPRFVNVGADVVAIGSPGLPGGSQILANTVTKGIVSAFRKSESYGLLLQTDVSINHGNSGGPLLSLRGEVIGVNTLGFREGGATGLNFAIFVSEVLDMLKQHFDFVPNYLQDQPRQEVAQASTIMSPDGAAMQLSATTNLAAGSTPAISPAPLPPAKTAILITSEPSGAEISVDGVFDSSTPSKLLLTPGEHIIRVSRPGIKTWERKIIVEVGAEKTFNALLEKEAPKTVPR
jgi:S1-C subfamily serine protease